MTTLESMSPREAYAAYVMGSVLLVDLREPAETEAKKLGVKQFIQLPYTELDQRFGELPANRQVVFISRIGIKGKEAAKFLMQNGYDNVAMIDGGFTAWEEEGLPVR